MRSALLALLGSRTLTLPRAGERQEVLRVPPLARCSAVDARRLALVQLRSLIVTAPEHLREELRRLPRAADPPLQLFCRSDSRPVEQLAIVLALRSLARRIQAATAEANQLEREIVGHVRALVPHLLDEIGVGPIVAAQLIVTWSHRDRVRSEPPSRVSPASHRCQPRADKRSGTASTAAVTASSTAPSTPSSSTAASTTPPRATTSLAAWPKAKAPATQPGSSSATSPAISTASCRTPFPPRLDSHRLSIPLATWSLPSAYRALSKRKAAKRAFLDNTMLS